jgi:hypothetical protein
MTSGRLKKKSLPHLLSPRQRWATVYSKVGWYKLIISPKFKKNYGYSLKVSMKIKVQFNFIEFCKA